MASRLSPRARAVAGVAGWLAAAAIATGVGMFAVGAIGGGLIPAAQEPISPQQLAGQARSLGPEQPDDASPPAQSSSSADRDAPAGSAQPAPKPRPRPEPPPERRRQAPQPKVISTPGGAILATCNGNRVVVTSATPKQGFAVDDDDDDDGGSTEVKFSSENVEVNAELYCAGGVPRAKVEREIDD